MNNTKALQLYPEQKEIDTLAHRIRDLLPGADKFADEVLVAFAQISLAHGLDPWIGEIWIIPTSRGPRIRAGIEGHRKSAHKQSPYQLRQRQMNSDERDAHGLHDKQVAAVSEIFRTDSRIEGLAFIPTCGYGFWSPGDNVAATKTPLWMAFKRSEQDALRKAFDLPFIREENGNGPAFPAPVGPDHRGAGAAPIPTSVPEPAGSARAAAADLYGDWHGDILPANHALSIAPAGDDHPPAAEPQEEIIDATATVISNEPPLDKWGRFTSPEAATTWAIRQGTFPSIDAAIAAYERLRDSSQATNAIELAPLWIELVENILQLSPRET